MLWALLQDWGSSPLHPLSPLTQSHCLILCKTRSAPCRLLALSEAGRLGPCPPCPPLSAQCLQPSGHKQELHKCREMEEGGTDTGGGARAAERGGVVLPKDPGRPQQERAGHTAGLPGLAAELTSSGSNCPTNPGFSHVPWWKWGHPALALVPTGQGMNGCRERTSQLSWGAGSCQGLTWSHVSLGSKPALYSPAALGYSRGPSGPQFPHLRSGQDDQLSR